MRMQENFLEAELSFVDPFEGSTNKPIEMGLSGLSSRSITLERITCRHGVRRSMTGLTADDVRDFLMERSLDDIVCTSMSGPLKYYVDLVSRLPTCRNLGKSTSFPRNLPARLYPSLVL